MGERKKGVGWSSILVMKSLALDRFESKILLAKYMILLRWHVCETVLA